jgi:dTDP-4-dehydrorhamnose reductase
VKVIITGASGQLGTDLSKHCGVAGDEVTALARTDLDISDADEVASIMQSVRPEIVFNCAAWTAVEACESDSDRAHLINGTAVGHLAASTADVGAHLVQVSTDYVFSGSKTTPYDESDPTDPHSVYGASKLAGEQAAGPAATIVRTSWVCSAHGGNMVATILRLVDQHRTLSFVSDQRGRPTFTTDLAQAMRSLADARFGGVVHLANDGDVSWFEFARHVLLAAGLDPQRVQPILTAELDPPQLAPRPTNSVLSTAHYESLGFAPLRHFTEPLGEIVPAYL